MQALSRWWISVVFLSILVAAALPDVTFAAACEQPVATVVSVQGTVESQRVGESGWQPAVLNDTFCPGDTIRVGNNSRAALALASEAVMRLNANSSFTLQEFRDKRSSVVDMFKGAAHFFSRQPKSLEVRTPYTIAGVRGTEFYIQVDETQTFLSIFEGNVLAANQAGELNLTSGQSAAAEKDKAPVLRVVARPRDAVNWALYYPPVLYDAPAGLIDRSPESITDPRLLTQQAALLLEVGRVEQASANLDRALAANPNDSDALALQSIIAIVQNEQDRALELARKAVDAAPQSATAWIALSYAKQAQFNLEDARDHLFEAVRVDPGNALAWARLSEIQASFGELSRALEAAKKAESLAPDLSLTQTVLGFANLNQVRIGDAKAAFEKAITLDQASPLARLGLGLAMIRSGDLKGGGREIETAASLDPNNSLIRSYLGKTFYEQKRTELDEKEYAIAKELDPNDPTPWFYDAIAKQTTNRPVEALQNMEQAIALNDNRAVFRSKLMLDSDLAARQSSLARIYNNLGFQQRGLVEGWNSVNTDPTNFSAHRFLSDTYSVLPRHEIARVSELLQSQLLQPINITPIQPNLAESNLFLISSQGPAAAGFNTFNPLFNRNQTTAQLSGLAGENSTWAGEGIVSGIYNKLSLSAGYSYFDTDGWYKNANQTDRIANFFMQYEFTPKTSVQAEYRYRSLEIGDVSLNYFEDNLQPFLNSESKNNLIRFGLRQAFSPDSILLGNFQYSDVDGNVSDLLFLDNVFFELPPPPVELATGSDSSEKAYSGELSYLFRSQFFNFVSGAGYFNIDQDVTFTDTLVWPGPPLIDFGTFESGLDQDIDHFDLYLYSYIKPTGNLTFTIGASGDFYNADDKDDIQGLDRNSFNPKFGISWHPFSSTTLRGAVFKTFKRTLITDQTLEPTQVSGFNQFYDDSNATEAWVYGVGVDQKISKRIYSGAEFLYRDLTIPYFSGITPPLQVKDGTADEYLGRFYFYYTPHDWIAIKAEYGYEKFDYTEDFNFGAEELTTQSVPLGINFFHPSGFFAGLTGTFYYQDGKFQNFETAVYEDDNNSFWIVDAAIGYRLPKRYGFITVGARNLFDEDDFRYWEVDTKNSRIQPERQAFVKVTLSLP